MALTGKVQAWVAGGVAGVVVIAAAGWFLLISPQFDDKAEADQRLADAQTQNIVLQKRLDTLRDKASHADDLKSQLAELFKAVPGQHDIEGFTRQLTGFASDAGVTITSISPTAPSQVTLPETEAPSAPATSAPAAGDTATTSPDATTGETAPPPPTETGPAGHLYSITVTVVTTGGMSGQRAFLAAIETEGARRALVTGTSFSPIIDSATNPAVGADAPAQGDGTVEGDSGTEGAAGDPAATSTEPPPPPPPSATEGQWTLTTQLLVFVAPQSPGQEAQLLDQLGGNG